MKNVEIEDRQKFTASFSVSIIECKFGDFVKVIDIKSEIHTSFVRIKKSLFIKHPKP